MAKLTLYGADMTRPGISPSEWYGVSQWRTRKSDAADDAMQMIRGWRSLQEAARLRWDVVDEPMVTVRERIAEVP